ncbi:hypothetical protein BDA96_02G442400 [Sorghum bicolor]|uniref:Uncharacterized protein n=1 Tax=Sorghum bicolor TaxID=4558 RepID=A0A921RUH0_SORBI|nr:hypothetical protein BDA96_02G442400 [Sorghum bicolor]
MPGEYIRRGLHRFLLMFIGRPVIFAGRATHRSQCSGNHVLLLSSYLETEHMQRTHASTSLQFLNSEVLSWYRYHIYGSIAQDQGPASLLIVVYRIYIYISAARTLVVAIYIAWLLVARIIPSPTYSKRTHLFGLLVKLFQYLN